MKPRGQKTNNHSGSFKPKGEILFTVDQKRIVIVDRLRDTCLILGYPEAAVWSVMVENADRSKAQLMLKAILGKGEQETASLVEQCLATWKNSGILE